MPYFRKKFISIIEWMEHWAETPYAMYALFIFAFVESSFFPIPPDILLVALLVANSRAKWFRYALVITAGSVLGGMLGYIIGFWFYEIVGRKIIEIYNLAEVMTRIGVQYSMHAFWTVFIAAFTPIPYKVITISAGFFKISIYQMIIASIVGRGLRFFVLAYLLKVFGPHVKNAIYRYFNALSIFFIVLLVGGFIALKFIF